MLYLTVYSATDIYPYMSNPDSITASFAMLQIEQHVVITQLQVKYGDGFVAYHHQLGADWQSLQLAFEQRTMPLGKTVVAMAGMVLALV